MEWREQAARLRELLDLAGQPIAVTYTNEDAPGPREKISICAALKRAAQGDSFIIEEENSACPGGTWHCGLKEPVAGSAKRGLQWYLTQGEKLTSSIVTFERMTKLTSPPPTGLAERILLGPAAKAEMRPDLMVFLCDPAQACRIVTLDAYWDGVPARWESAGSLCHMVIAYPLSSGQSNLSLGDHTARRHQGFADDVVFVTVPYERLAPLIAAIPTCSAGTAETLPPPRMQD
ncbi:MAG: DUF169 domain-containing protein [Candidatus Geothermincolia bacterium]